jgi:hypothetical protein
LYGKVKKFCFVEVFIFIFIWIVIKNDWCDIKSEKSYNILKLTFFERSENKGRGWENGYQTDPIFLIRGKLHNDGKHTLEQSLC